LVTTVELSNQLGVSPDRIRLLFHYWCEMNGVDPHNFMRIKFHKKETVPNRIPSRYYDIPDEAVDWIRNHRNWRKPYRQRRRNEDIINLSRLAREVGTTPERIKTEFKWWCHARGEDFTDYHQGGKGYVLPEEFVQYIRRIMGRQYDEAQEAT